MIESYRTNNVDSMHDCGRQLATQLQLPAVCYLQGQLGAGKTTLVQGIAQGFGYTDNVTSPTYNLVHEYPTSTAAIFHLDLYRLDHPNELEMLGLRDILSDQPYYLLLVEWPEKGQGHLPAADYVITIEVSEQGRTVVTNGPTSRLPKPTS